MLLCAIAYARIPTIDVPFLAHVFTSPLDVFPIAYFCGSGSPEARLRYICKLIASNICSSVRPVFRAASIARCTTSSACVCCLVMRTYLQWLGEPSIGQPDNRSKANTGGAD